MNRGDYQVYVNAPMIGVMQAGECIVIEENNQITVFEFRYKPDYLDQSSAFPLDPKQLPLSPASMSFECANGAMPGILDDYLPDKWGRKVLARLVQYREKRAINANSIIEMLGYIGDSRIGTMHIRQTFSGKKSKASLPVYHKGMKIKNLYKAENIAQRIDSGELLDIGVDEMSLIYLANSGTGVGGARPKALIEDDDGNAFLAKFNQSTDPYNNAKIELACLTMAKEAGLDVKSGCIEENVNGRDVLLLERFDINQDGTRNHMVTLNTLLKEPETQKDSGLPFTYDRIYEVLQRYSYQIEGDATQLLKVMLYNRLINNTDDHERNFSLMYSGNQCQLSPAYDLVPSFAHGEYHQAGFNYKPNPPSLNAALNIGKIFGLSKVIVKGIIDQLRSATENWNNHADGAGLTEEESDRIKSVFNMKT